MEECRNGISYWLDLPPGCNRGKSRFSLGYPTTCWGRSNILISIFSCIGVILEAASLGAEFFRWFLGPKGRLELEQDWGWTLAACHSIKPILLSFRLHHFQLRVLSGLERLFGVWNHAYHWKSIILEEMVDGFIGWFTWFLWMFEKCDLQLAATESRPSSFLFLFWNLIFLIVLFYDCVAASNEWNKFVTRFEMHNPTNLTSLNQAWKYHKNNIWLIPFIYYSTICIRLICILELKTLHGFCHGFFKWLTNNSLLFCHCHLRWASHCRPFE